MALERRGLVGVALGRCGLGGLSVVNEVSESGTFDSSYHSRGPVFSASHCDEETEMENSLCFYFNQ